MSLHAGSSRWNSSGLGGTRGWGTLTSNLAGLAWATLTLLFGTATMRHVAGFAVLVGSCALMTPAHPGAVTRDVMGPTHCIVVPSRAGHGAGEVEPWADVEVLDETRQAHDLAGEPAGGNQALARRVIGGEDQCAFGITDVGRVVDG